MKKLIILSLIIIIVFSYSVFAGSQQPPLDLYGLSLGDSQSKVLNKLGNDYTEEYVDDVSNYVGEDYYIWHYDNGLDIYIGKNTKEIITITINESNVKTALNAKVGDNAQEVLKNYRKKYKELVDIHTDQPVNGWFKVSDDTLLIFDFDRNDLTRVNGPVTSNSKVATIELIYRSYFD
ncbi:hypothetical protein [Sporosalibacterium faouarense]|uniref:hypothetical protein n=1 Tax=Sporosalibacterium faouarense TaxID=516123 RepID=UPI00141C9684|nr:hypothetical protein [Sporosalibacterium faouarense]MTI49852.1 hypothetical protein [Bacillota bacterium]